MSETYRIIDFKRKAYAMDSIRDLPLDGSKIVTIADYKKDRTLAQNRLAFKWYSELDGKLQKDYERQRCKLTRGIPILRRDDQEFNIFYKQALIHLTFEQKLAAMEFVPVTRLMNTKQFTEYLELIDREAANNGVILSHPSDIYDEAMGIRC